MNSRTGREIAGFCLMSCTSMRVLAPGALREKPIKMSRRHRHYTDLTSRAPAIIFDRIATRHDEMVPARFQLKYCGDTTPSLATPLCFGACPLNLNLGGTSGYSSGTYTSREKMASRRGEFCSGMIVACQS